MYVHIFDRICAIELCTFHVKMMSDVAHTHTFYLSCIVLLLYYFTRFQRNVTSDSTTS